MGYLAGKENGRIKEIKDRISRDIIEFIRRGAVIPSYYNSQDIEYAQKYGKRHGVFFMIEKPIKLNVIHGGKSNE